MTNLRSIAFIALAVLLVSAVAFYTLNNTVKTTYAVSGVNTVSSTANVQAYCQIGIAANAVINFTSVSPGIADVGLPANLVIANTVGNSAGNILVQGTLWAYGTNTMVNSLTLWNPTSVTTPTGNGLKLFPNNAVNTLIALPITAGVTTTNNIYFDLAATPAGQTAGVYTQTIVLQNSCAGGGTTNNANIVATVNVLAQCFITISNTAISFGNINPGSAAPTANQILVSNPNGNINANIEVEGSNWIVLPGPTPNFYAANTLWNPTSAGASIGNSITNGLHGFAGTPGASNFLDTSITVPGTGSASNNIFFGVTVPPGQQSGIYSANVYIENFC